MPLSRSSPRRTKRARLLIGATLILAGCVTTTGSVATDPTTAICASFRPITWSSRDTDETIKQVKAHNSVYLAICPRR